jgi:hypothetical protein
MTEILNKFFNISELFLVEENKPNIQITSMKKYGNERKEKSLFERSEFVIF